MSKFGWSLPAGCGRLPTEYDEEPFISRMCPNCKAIGVDWEANQVGTPFFDSEDGVCQTFACLYCRNLFHSWNMDGFVDLSIDEFTDMVYDHLPDNWEIVEIGEDWRSIVVGFVEEEVVDGKLTFREIIREVKLNFCLDEKGQISYSLSRIKSDIEQYLHNANLG